MKLENKSSYLNDEFFLFSILFNYQSVNYKAQNNWGSNIDCHYLIRICARWTSAEWIKSDVGNERKALLNPLFLFFLQHFISFAMGSTQSKSAQPVIFYNQSSPLQVNESQCGRVEIHVIISFFFLKKLVFSSRRGTCKEHKGRLRKRD